MGSVGNYRGRATEATKDRSWPQLAAMMWRQWRQPLRKWQAGDENETELAQAEQCEQGDCHEKDQAVIFADSGRSIFAFPALLRLVMLT